jgi:peptidoglycan hydrolase CwlO-like protein
VGRITNLQRDIAALQVALSDRNSKIATLNRDLSKERETIASLRAEIEALRNPKTAEAA